MKQFFEYDVDPKYYRQRRSQNAKTESATGNMKRFSIKTSLPVLFVGVLALMMTSCSPPVESSKSSNAQEVSKIEDAVAQLESDGGDIQYSIWLGSPDGDAWYRHNADIQRPAASAIKTAILLEFFSEQIDSLDLPFAALNDIIDNPLSPAINHFEISQQAVVRRELRGLTSRELAEAMIHNKHVESNAAYNAAANVIIEYLGGPTALTQRVRHRFPQADGIQIARYMLADRQKNADNLLTAESLSLVLQRIAKGTSTDALSNAVRAVMLLESDVSRGDHYYKGGTLTSEPQVRIEAGWWDNQGTACIYVVIATRPVGGGNDYDKMRSKLEGLSKMVQEVGIQIRDDLHASPQ